MKNLKKKSFATADIKQSFLPSSLEAKAYFTFLKNALVSPRKTGAICPSSYFLTAALTQAVITQKRGLIIDLGAGTGNVTAALLRSGVSAESIVTVERDKNLVACLKKSHPAVNVHNEDAKDIYDLLMGAYKGQPVQAVISSLPFRSIPQKNTEQICAALHAVLKQHNTLLVQFSYAWWCRYPLSRYGFCPTRRFMVLRNIPPAIVEIYKTYQ